MSPAERAATPEPARPARRRRWLFAAGLALVGASCLVVWATRPQPDPVRTAVAVTATSTATTPASADAERAADLAASPQVPPPTRLRVGAIGVSTRLSRLGLRADHTVEVPGDPAVAGWFDLGPPPGATGSAVILGHVDSIEGPAVFARLKELVPGDHVEVGRADGTVVVFEVTSVEIFPNASFPAQRVYGARRAKRLNLVTCGGSYDRSRGGYQSNVVVFTRWIGTEPVPRRPPRLLDGDPR